MITSAAITLFQSSELKQLAVKDDATAVLGYINLGILEIYKRFPLWEEEATITIVDGTLLYKLDGVDVNVSIDLTNHNVLMIERLYLDFSDDTEYDGELTLNSNKDRYQIKTPKPHQILLSTPASTGLRKTPYEVGDTLTAFYRATPKFLTVTNTALPIPEQFLEALGLFVAYKGQMSVKQGDRDESNTAFKKFEASCNLIKFEGLVQQDHLESSKFHTRGFV